MAAGVLVSCLVSMYSPSAVAMLAFVPAFTLTVHFYVWNLVTGFLVESSALTAVLAAVCIWCNGQMAEEIWGRFEMVRFVVVVSFATHITVFGYALFRYITGTEGVFYQSFCGALGLAQAVLVAQAQLRPDEQPVPSVPIRWKSAPLIVACIAAVWEVAYPTHIPTESEIGVGMPLFRGTDLFHAFLSPWFAWVYLRFFQKTTVGQQIPGDVSESFALKTFFPTPIQPAVGAAASAVFSVVSVTGFGAALREAAAARAGFDDFAMMEGPHVSAEQALTAMGTSASVADRRRQIALAALQERLESVKQAAQDTSLQGFDVEAGGPQSAVTPSTTL
eukprot:TRINITY_DN32850_c0_g1_i1.p1 TRINITY_DN32850_c0_g1~~TRINITY_DN32850_c0_g1_i1.p1  ORF type:complete len:361 (+),score=107.03 TRINITY_DN32850_c0_g1_i1:84-1085(+)